MLNRYDIINSPDFFRDFIEQKYVSESKDPEFKKDFPTLNSYLLNAKLILRSARDQYVEKFYEMGITDIKYIVETMLNFSNSDLNFNTNINTLMNQCIDEINQNSENNTGETL